MLGIQERATLSHIIFGAELTCLKSGTPPLDSSLSWCLVAKMIFQLFEGFCLFFSRECYIKFDIVKILSFLAIVVKY